MKVFRTRVSRLFLLIVGLYLIGGMIMGSYTGAMGDRSLVPVHAHINLPGFALMSGFGLVCYLCPKMEGTMLARVHFWLHQSGTLMLLAGFWLMISPRLPERTVGPVMPVVELCLILGAVVFMVNRKRNLT